MNKHFFHKIKSHNFFKNFRIEKIVPFFIIWFWYKWERKCILNFDAWNRRGKRKYILSERESFYFYIKTTHDSDYFYLWMCILMLSHVHIFIFYLLSKNYSPMLNICWIHFFAKYNRSLYGYWLLNLVICQDDYLKNIRKINYVIFPKLCDHIWHK